MQIAKEIMEKDDAARQSSEALKRGRTAATDWKTGRKLVSIITPLPIPLPLIGKY